MVLCASAAYPGVVLSETHTTAGPNGKEVQDRTIYVQRNKQKIKGPLLQVITGLDKGIVYIIDPRRREYIQSPLEAVSALMLARNIDLEES